MAAPGQRPQEPVNFIRQFLSAMDKIHEEESLNATHVSLYIGLFTLWNYNHFQNPISINRKEVMSISKIGSKHTYHKCLRDLHKLKFINYHPSHNPMKGSLIDMCIFGTSSEQVVDQFRGKSGTSSEQVLHPSINNRNYINNKQYIYEEAFSKKEKKGSTDESDCSRTQNAIADTGRKLSPKNQSFLPPSKKELSAFFDQLARENKIVKFPAAEEAEKFINYYSAKGWKIGASSSMKDWQAAARNWLMNYKKFNKQTEAPPHTAGHLHSNENKDYNMKL